MSKDLFKNLIEAVVALAADEVVKLLDSKREPVADAAMVLHLDHGFTLNWLRARKAEEILGACVSARRNQDVYVGLLMNGLLYEINSDGYSFRLKYPDRERTADSAQYLWKSQISGDWEFVLKNYDSAAIRGSAKRRQEVLCAKVADAAWIAFDEGGYRLDLKFSSVERILDLATRAKARSNCDAPKKMIGILKLEGFGKFGQGVKIEGIPVFDDSGVSTDPESEFVKSRAEAHGLTVVTGILYSFGPGIFCQ